MLVPFIFPSLVFVLVLLKLLYESMGQDHTTF